MIDCNINIALVRKKHLCKLFFTFGIEFEFTLKPKKLKQLKKSATIFVHYKYACLENTKNKLNYLEQGLFG